MRKYLLAGIFLLVAGIAFGADVRRLISVGDINFGSGTFTDTAGLVLYKVNADNVPFSQDNDVKVGTLYYLALAADNGVSSYCLKSAGDNTFYWGVCSTVSDISWDNVAITGGTVDNVVIGGTTAAAGTFTTVATDCVTNTELSYVGGVTSAIQTQIDTKRASDNNTFSGPATFDNEVQAASFASTAADGEHFINVANSAAPTDNVTTGDCYYDNVALQWLCWDGDSWEGGTGGSTTSLPWDNITSKPVLLTPDNTATLTNKTLDASATGNVLKQTKYLTFQNPRFANGSGATWDNDYKEVNFSATTDKAENCAVYYADVPDDLDNTVDLAARFKFALDGGADTAAHNYVIVMDTATDSTKTSTYYEEMGNEVAMTFAGDANGAQYDAETVGWTTLTGWAAALSGAQGNFWSIAVCRDGDSDASTRYSTSLTLSIRYGSVQ